MRFKKVILVKTKSLAVKTAAKLRVSGWLYWQSMMCNDYLLIIVMICKVFHLNKRNVKEALEAPSISRSRADDRP